MAEQENSDETLYYSFPNDEMREKDEVKEEKKEEVKKEDGKKIDEELKPQEGATLAFLESLKIFRNLREKAEARGDKERAEEYKKREEAIEDDIKCHKEMKEMEKRQEAAARGRKILEDEYARERKETYELLYENKKGCCCSIL